MNRLYTDDSDAGLVVQVLAGNREAFGALANRYYASLLRLCVRLLSDPVQAQDVAQEALLQAFLGLDRLQQPARFGAWLHAIAANLARSSLRRVKPLSLNGLESDGHLAFRRATPFPSTEQVVALRETHDAIVAALIELSTVNREAVIGYYLQGYSYAELAALLRVPVSTVKSRLFKGRQQLRRHLEGLRQPVQIRKESPVTPDLIPLQIEMICEDVLTQRSILVLRTWTDNRYLPIKLMPDEAAAIERALKNQPDALPVSHQDTLLQLVSSLGGRIEQILLQPLVEQNYYASLVLAQDGGRHEIHCRLSDALLLAVRGQIPIQVAPGLLQEGGVTLENMDIDPAVPEAELPDAPEPVTTSDQWPDTFVEQVWSFLLSVVYKHRKPHDLSGLRSIAWDEFFSVREVDWENQTVQMVRLPGAQPAWLAVRPELWTQIKDFVDWVQDRDTQPSSRPQMLFVPLDGDRQKQIDELLEETWPALIDLGARTVALVHLHGKLISWRSLDSYESAVRMGRAAVRDLLLTRHFHALVHAAAEPAIRITYERSTAFNPAQAAGDNVFSSSEVLIHDKWLLVIGWAWDPQGRQVHELLERIRGSMEVLLPD